MSSIVNRATFFSDAFISNWLIIFLLPRMRECTRVGTAVVYTFVVATTTTTANIQDRIASFRFVCCKKVKDDSKIALAVNNIPATMGQSMRPQRKYSDNLKPYLIIIGNYCLVVLFTNFMHDYIKHLSLHRPACIYV